MSDPNAEVDPEPEPEQDFMQRPMADALSDSFQATVQGDGTSQPHDFAPDQPLSKPKFRSIHQQSVDNWEREKSTMAETIIFARTIESTVEDDCRPVIESVIESIWIHGTDSDAAYAADMRSLISWQEPMFLADSIGRLSGVLASGAEVAGLKQKAVEKIETARLRHTAMRDEIISKLVQIKMESAAEVDQVELDTRLVITDSTKSAAAARRAAAAKLTANEVQNVRMMQRNYQSMSLGELISARKQIKKDPKSQLISEAERENDEIQSDVAAATKELHSLHELEFSAHELWCYRQLHAMLLARQDDPQSGFDLRFRHSVIPCKPGRPLHVADKKLFNTIAKEFSEGEPHLQGKLTEAMGPIELAEAIQCTCVAYSQPSDIIRAKFVKVCAKLQAWVADSNVQLYEVRRYLMFHYAMSTLQVDGLLLWMCTPEHMSEIQDLCINGCEYSAFMDAAVEQWVQQLGVN